MQEIRLKPHYYQTRKLLNNAWNINLVCLFDQRCLLAWGKCKLKEHGRYASSICLLVVIKKNQTNLESSYKSKKNKPDNQKKIMEKKNKQIWEHSINEIFPHITIKIICGETRNNYSDLIKHFGMTFTFHPYQLLSQNSELQMQQCSVWLLVGGIEQMTTQN